MWSAAGSFRLFLPTDLTFTGHRDWRWVLFFSKWTTSSVGHSSTLEPVVLLDLRDYTFSKLLDYWRMIFTEMKRLWLNITVWQVSMDGEKSRKSFATRTTTITSRKPCRKFVFKCMYVRYPFTITTSLLINSEVVIFYPSPTHYFTTATRSQKERSCRHHSGDKLYHCNQVSRNLLSSAHFHFLLTYFLLSA